MTLFIGLYYLVINLWLHHAVVEEKTPQPVHPISKPTVSEQLNIPYISADSRNFHPTKHLLDMYWPAVQENCPVVVFIHGGTWMSGSKDLYGDLGRNFASKGITTAIISYRLGDQVQYNSMAEDCAAAVKWVHDHASQYNGDPSRLVVSGHSAGAHLASLISLDTGYMKALNTPNPIRGCILIDAFGLNIDTFIRSPFGQSYMAYIEKVFTRDEATWKKASPVSHIHERDIPFFITTGSRNYPFLLADNELFIRRLKAAGRNVTYQKIIGKNHTEMVSQLQQSTNPLYASMVKFLQEKVPR
jgi:acetyl esterase/lipase